MPARLIVDSKDHGIQMFLVQLRDLQTHQPMPGKVLFAYYDTFNTVATGL